MEIPVRWIYDRNNANSEALLGSGRRAMAVLEDLMRLRGLEQYALVFEPYPGAVIRCRKVFGRREVEIVAPFGGPRKRTEIIRECLCFKHFSFGVVVRVNPPEPVIGVDPVTGAPFIETQGEFDARLEQYLDALPTVRFTYDVAVCAKDKFILCKEVIDANFGRYIPGQHVLVTIGSEMEDWDVPLDCDRDCLLNNPRFEILAVSPTHVISKMGKKWNKVTEREVLS